jgi:steroid delta-isomerase-like uncharacterized protein
MTPAATRAVVLAYLRALNDGDVDAAAACVAEDFRNEHTSSLGHSVEGREAYRARLPEFLGRFRDLRYDVEDLLVEGDRAAVAYTMTFRWDADGRDVPVRLRGMFRFRVADGHVAHRVDYWDGVDFQRQIGAA